MEKKTERERFCAYNFLNADVYTCERRVQWKVTTSEGKIYQVCDECIYWVCDEEGDNIVRHLNDIFGEEERQEQEIASISDGYGPEVVTVLAKLGATYTRPEFTIEDD